MQIAILFSLSTLVSTTVAGSHAAPWKLKKNLMPTQEARSNDYSYWKHPDKPLLLPAEITDPVLLPPALPKHSFPFKRESPQKHDINSGSINNAPVVDSRWDIGDFSMPDDWMCVALEKPRDDGLRQYACMEQINFARDYNSIEKLRKRRVGYIAGLIVVCILLLSVTLLFLLFFLRRKKQETRPADVEQRDLLETERHWNEQREKNPHGRETARAERRFRELQERQVAPAAAPAPDV